MCRVFCRDALRDDGVHGTGLNPVGGGGPGGCARGVSTVPDARMMLRGRITSMDACHHPRHGITVISTPSACALFQFVNLESPRLRALSFQMSREAPHPQCQPPDVASANRYLFDRLLDLSPPASCRP